MKSIEFFALAALALAAPAGGAGAQSMDSRCADPAVVGAAHEGGDACQKAVDLYRYIGVQLGTLVAGGNAVLGRGGTLGGLGHFTAELRVNTMHASIPDVGGTAISLGAPRQSTYDVNGKWVAIPQVDVSLGLFKGIPVGITYVGGIDAIVSAAYVPDMKSGSVSVSAPGGSLKLGYGGRLGIISESALTPGVSVTWLQRELPTTTITATEGSNSLTVQDLEISARSWRIVASKSFLVFGLAAGVGQDEYRARTAITYDVAGNHPQQPYALEIEPKRTNMFVDLTLTPLPLVRIVGELGRVSGGDIGTYNRFDPAAGDPRLYGSVGLRIGF
jgi:hypothetical protein